MSPEAESKLILSASSMSVSVVRSTLSEVHYALEKQRPEVHRMAVLEQQGHRQTTCWGIPVGSTYDHGPQVPFMILNSSHAPSPSPVDVLST